MKSSLLKKVLNLIATIVTAALTALGTTSCHINIEPGGVVETPAYQAE